MIAYFLLIAGLVILVTGGDILVRGAVALAERLSIPPLIIGLTIVSLGTSAPEMFVSIQAALEGSGGLAIGNVIGSNIANVLLVLGIPAMITASCCKEQGIGRNILVMTGFTLVFMGMLMTGSLEWYHGAILLVLLTLFLFDQYHFAKSSRQAKAAYEDEQPAHPSALWVSGLLLVAGIALLPIGAGLTVHSAQDIARNWGVSEEAIGLTVVAIGTSLPELAASVMAVARGNSSVAIGNVVGSNIFNIAAIMGVTALVTPIAVSTHFLVVDMWVMLAATLLLAAIAWHLQHISRLSGLVMVAGYTIYVITAFLT